MAANSSRDPAAYHLDPIQYYDNAALTYEDDSMTMKDVARHLLALGPEPFYSTFVVLDSACGPDTATGEICARISPESLPQTIYATDESAEMIKMLNEK
jgi:hypothetical protein